MDNSPFCRIVLPAPTWPMPSDRATQISERLPQSLSYWDDSALITNQHKEFSVRYVGFAILSSVTIGAETAEAMGTRQGRGPRHQGLIDPMLPVDDQQDDFWCDRLLTTESTNQSHATDLAASHDVTMAAPTAKLATSLDWESSQQPIPDSQAQAELMSSPMDEQVLYHIQGADQCRSLALAIEGEYYGYYRNRPNLDKTRTLVQQLHQQGKRALVTQDDNGYVVWVHLLERPQQAFLWLEPLATS